MCPGTAKIADVGLAKMLSREHTQVSKETTFDWAAPEVGCSAILTEERHFEALLHPSPLQ